MNTFLRSAIQGSLLLWPAFALAAGDVPRPRDISLTPPSADVPADCSVFFDAGGWGKGKWDKRRPGELWVERVRPDCTADVIFGWGDAPGSSRKGGFVRVSDAQILGGRLRFHVSEPSTAEVVYDLIDDGASLQGVYKATGGEENAYIKLYRGAD